MYHHHCFPYKSSSEIRYLLSLKTSWSAALNLVFDMLLVDKCSRPCCFHKLNFSHKSIKPNYIKVHNTYYNNMVCYINNKQSDTDSHQSKVNNHRSQSDICKLLQISIYLQYIVYIRFLGERESDC